jgi:nucleoside-diphosphate-sugar epimerase
VRILVTGATGKLGNAVAGRLAGRGDEVVALVRDAARARELLPEGVALAVGDVTDADSVARACEGGLDAAVNCMGIFEQWLKDAGRFDRVNGEGARRVVAAAREAGATRVVHTSTFDVFDAAPGSTVSEDRVADYPKGTAYERSKQLAERLVLEEAAHGIEVVMVNPAGIYGPGVWVESGFDAMLRDALRKRLPAVPPGGLTLAFIDDVAAAHVAALDRGVPGERYAIGDGYATLRQMCEVAIAAAGRGRAPLTMPRPVAGAVARTGEAVANLTGRPPLLGRGQLEFFQWGARIEDDKARRELGIEITPWEDGIGRTARWIVDSGRAG